MDRASESPRAAVAPPAWVGLARAARRPQWARPRLLPRAVRAGPGRRTSPHLVARCLRQGWPGLAGRVSERLGASRLAPILCDARARVSAAAPPCDVRVLASKGWPIVLRWPVAEVARGPGPGPPQRAGSSCREATPQGRPCDPTRRREAAPWHDPIGLRQGPDHERLLWPLLGHCSSRCGVTTHPLLSEHLESICIPRPCHHFAVWINVGHFNGCRIKPITDFRVDVRPSCACGQNSFAHT